MSKCPRAPESVGPWGLDAVRLYRRYTTGHRNASIGLSTYKTLRSFHVGVPYGITTLDLDPQLHYLAVR